MYLCSMYTCAWPCCSVYINSDLKKKEKSEERREYVHTLVPDALRYVIICTRLSL